MGKYLPVVNFVELLKIHKLLGTFAPVDIEKVDEIIDDDIPGYITHIERNKNFTALRIGLLKYSDILDELNFTDYIIYLIILEHNLQLKFFSEDNMYLSELTGLSSSKVEQSLHDLLEQEYIFYVDMYGEICHFRNKPYSRKKYDEIQTNSNELLAPCKFRVNDVRQFVVNSDFLEELDNLISLTEEEKAAKRKILRKKRMLEKEYKKEINNALHQISSYPHEEIHIETIKKYKNKNFQNENSRLCGYIEAVLNEKKFKIDEIIEYYYVKEKEKKKKMELEKKKVQNIS